MMDRRPAHSICDDSWRHMARVMSWHPILCINIRGRQPFVRCDAPGSELRPSEVLPLWFDSRCTQRALAPSESARFQTRHL